MNNDRDMYYGNYGYVSNPLPNGMMPMMQGGMMPMMQNPNINYGMPYSNQNMMPCNQNNNSNNTDFDNRLGYKYKIIHNNCLTHIMHYRNIDYINNVKISNLNIKTVGGRSL